MGVGTPLELLFATKEEKIKLRGGARNFQSGKGLRVALVCMRARDQRPVLQLANWQEMDYTGSGFDAGAQGCGRRASMKAKLVIRTASADIAASSKTFFRLMGSGVAKHPQLMSMCNR